MSGSFLKQSRITLLLFILLAVAVGEWLTKERSTDWNDTLWVAVYPINGDGSEVSQDYIDSLESDNYSAITEFMNREADSYDMTLKKPVSVFLAPEINERPPSPPPNGNVLSIMAWSLKMRYWAWSRDNFDSPKDIQIFVLYYDPDTNPRLAHSIGLQKGLMGVVNAFSTNKMKGENNFVIAHEMLHTLGATDKYDFASNLPIYPIGYAEPDRDPLYPQKWAEIMGGTIPKNETKSEMPKSLKKAVLGEATAQEIRWLNFE